MLRVALLEAIETVIGFEAVCVVLTDPQTSVGLRRWPTCHVSGAARPDRIKYLTP